MGFEIENIYDAGDDVLEVIATSGERAHGWVSAMTNHYDPDAYEEDGNLREGATPRAMTPVEVGEYAARLLVEQNPPQDAPTEPAPIAFVAPGT